MIGVYEIRNTVTGKAYIGASTNIKRRWTSHRWLLRHQKHRNSTLQADWHKYGEDKFSFSVVIEGISRKDLGLLEQEYIGSCSDLYNYREDVYDFTRRNPTSIEARKKIAAANKGKKRTNEAKKRMSEAKRGEKHGRAKLTWDKVRQIRAIYAKHGSTQVKLAEQFGVSRRAVRNIINNKSWIEE